MIQKSKIILNESILTLLEELLNRKRNQITLYKKINALRLGKSIPEADKSVVNLELKAITNEKIKTEAEIQSTKTLIKESKKLQAVKSKLSIVDKIKLIKDNNITKE